RLSFLINVTATTVIYTLSLHDALPISSYDLIKAEGISLDLQDEYQICTAENFFPSINPGVFDSYSWLLDGVKVDSTDTFRPNVEDRKSTRLNSSHVKISYAVFCLKKKK